ncbi:MAG: protein-disulfide reductase DsbD N-terminal domain-containing protein [Blastocatellia bacterium]|nr:protein-disulfide reductase DsbD N-terminal domain-containing protein [Blastocatellia bacterium]
MMKKYFLHLTHGAGLLLILTMTVLGQSDSRKLDPIKWAVKSDLSARALKIGEKFAVQIVATIEENWHLYSTKEIELGPRPTRFSAATGQAFALAGEIVAPKPLRAFDNNFNTDLEYYEHAATFTVPFVVEANASAGKQTLIVQVRYQACTTGLCLPPKAVKLEVPLEIQNPQ